MNNQLLQLFRIYLCVILLLIPINISLAVSIFEFPRPLEQGDSGNDVQHLQISLRDLGYFTFDNITDYYGFHTEQAVKRLQMQLGIVTEGTPETTGFGRFGPLTLAALRTELTSLYNSDNDTLPVLHLDLTVPGLDLALGSTGSAVQALQAILNQLGYTVATSGPGSIGSETTYFGTATQAALIAFQKANSIEPAAGFYGPLTRATLSIKQAQRTTALTPSIPQNYITTPTSTVSTTTNVVTRTIRGGSRAQTNEPVITPPSAISNLIASTPAVPAAITLSFTPQAEATVVEYRWRISGETDWSNARSLPSDYIARDNMPSDTNIEVQIRSENAAGFSDWSNIALGKTLKYALLWFIGGQSNADGWAPINQDPDKADTANADKYTYHKPTGTAAKYAYY